MKDNCSEILKRNIGHARSDSTTLRLEDTVTRDLHRPHILIDIRFNVKN